MFPEDRAGNRGIARAGRAEWVLRDPETRREYLWKRRSAGTMAEREPFRIADVADGHVQDGHVQELGKKTLAGQYGPGNNPCPVTSRPWAVHEGSGQEPVNRGSSCP